MWFPTVLSFVAAAIAYVIDPSLANDKVYLVLVMLGVFWALTLANFFGMKWTLRLNNPAVIIGTLIPAAVLIATRHLLAGRRASTTRSRSMRSKLAAEPEQRQQPGVLRRCGARLRGHRDGGLPRQGDEQPQA